MPVDWSAGGDVQPGAALQVGQQAQQAGLTLGQQQATYSALRGVDLNNPGTVDNAITGLIHANSFDQANALMGLNATRTIYSKILPMVTARLSGQPTDSSSSGTAPGTVTQSAQTPPDSNSPEFAQAHGQIMQQASQAAQTLLNTPIEQRAALADQMEKQFVAQGIPPEAAHEALDDVSDAGLTKQLQYFQQHAAWMQGQAQPGTQPTPAPDHPTQFDWATKAINDPVLNDPFVQSALKRVGFDIEPYLQRAQQIAMPEITQEAQEAHAAGIATNTEAGKEAAEIALAPATMAIEAQKAGMVATAEQQARAPYDFETVKGPNGQDVYVRKDFAVKYAGQHGGVLGQSIAPPEQAFRTAQAGQAAELLKPLPVALNQARDTQANAERALSIIQAMKFDQTTPIKAQIANGLRSAGLGGDQISQYANDVAGYNQITTQALAQGAHSVFPQRTTNTDIKLMHNVIPTLTTPNDAAAVAMGTQAAQAMRAQDWETFKANYSGPHESPNDIYKAWQAGPGGQSIFQSREWQNVPIGGRPAFNPATDVKTIKGVKVGAWGIGTGHPVYFVVQ